MERTLKIVIIIIAVTGNIVSLVGLISNWIMGFGCKWVWLVSALGWGLLVGALADLMNLEKYVSENIGKEKSNGN